MSRYVCDYNIDVQFQSSGLSGDSVKSSLVRLPNCFKATPDSMYSVRRKLVCISRTGLHNSNIPAYWSES